ncbi:MAG: hypothetical protein FJ403_02165 [Verrucomicrobia bacterium]|nr:hypothetical protein [Verrucomicrobiota bacterium]
MKRAVLPLVALVFLLATALRGAAANHSTYSAVSSRCKSLEGTTLPEIVVATPEGTNRVTVGAIIQPVVASPGDSITATVKVRIAPGHWIYALENSGSRNQPTALEPKLNGRPLRATGPWRGPEPKTKDDGSRIYATEAVFQRRFVIEPSAKETTRKLPITIKYQVCNEALCWPPATISVEPVLKVSRSPK